MDVLKRSEAILRSSQPLLPFLAPTTYQTSAIRRTAAVARHCRTQQPRCSARRTFASCAARRQRDTAADSVRQARYGEDRAAQQPPAPRDEPEDDIARLFRSLDLSLDTRSRRSSASNDQDRSVTGAQQEDRFSDLDEYGPKPGSSSMDDMLKAIMDPPSRPPRGSISQHADARSMLAGASQPRSTLTSLPPTYQEKVLPIKLGPSVGRTIRVNTDRGIDVGRAFRMLDITLARNRVRADFRMQRFHERPGLKRKRLKRERWSRRFKEGFQAIVNKVQRMRSQGW